MKKGYNPFEKQSSTLSNNQVLDLMGHYNFEVQTLPKPVEIKKAFRHAIMGAMRQFGENAHISNTGESVFFAGQNVITGQSVRDVRVKLSNMLGIGEQEALYKITGIPEFNPFPERKVA